MVVSIIHESTITTIFLSRTCLLQIVVVVDGGVGF